MNNLILLSASAAEPLAHAGSTGFWDILLKVLIGLAAIVIVMCFAALSVVAERKVAAFIQGRHGPNRTCIPYVMLIPFVGKFLQKNGLMQLAADGLKFLLKEEPLPSHVNKFWYTLAPVMSLAPVLIAACAIPFGFYPDGGGARALAAADFDLSLLFVLALGSLGVYGAVMAGWSSNSKFSYLGGIRASAQMVSYEIVMMLSLIPVVLWIAPDCASPLSLFELGKSQETMWNVVKFPVSALLFLVALFAETNRLPFDMMESETDLVSGFHTEYGSFKFGLFFVGEYGHMVVGSAVFACVFLGAWSPMPGFSYPLELGWIAGLLSALTFLAKIAFMIFFFIWVRWTLPRFRYDHVMNLGWGKLLPLSVANLLAYMVFAAFIK
ncbi:MAG: NADH-quinone oxidoreductase subunit H [Opitutales bacterium]|nr:NADH-quinone oxidoreductase subunit H [Opitutales bacterium]